MRAPLRSTPGRLKFPLLPLLLVSLALSRPCPAQNSKPRFDHISTLQGLSQSTVNAILQDQQGFMWFGTQDGLNMFNGYEFTTFRKSLSGPASISDNYIWCLLQARNGDIWAGTMNDGLNCYSVDENRFIRYRHDPADSTSLGAQNVTALCQDSDGAIWVGLWGGGVDRFDPAKNRFLHFRHRPDDPNSVSSNFVRCIVEDRSGLLWIGTWSGLVCYDRRSGSFVRYRHDPRNPRSLGDDHIVGVYEDRAGRLWVITLDSGLDLFDRANQRFSHFRHDPKDSYTPCSNAMRCVCEDNQGSLWFGSAGAGISILDTATGKFKGVRADAHDPQSLCSNRVYSILRDRTGSLWIGSGDAGISRYDPNRPKFTLLTDPAGDPRSPDIRNVRALVEDRHGFLWVGSVGGGVSRFDRRSGLVQHFRHVANDPSSIASNSVFVIFEDHTGVLWIGTQDAGVDRFDPGGRFIHYRPGPGKQRRINGLSIMAINECRDGTLWVGTTGSGLHRYDRNSDSFTPVSPGNGSISGDGSVWAIHEDRRGILWLGTWGAGLIQYDRAANTIRRFACNPADSTTLSNNTVWSICEDGDGALWFGTWGGGLNRYDVGTRSFLQLTRTDGLPNDVVYGILPDERGNLWISTNDGLSKFTSSSRLFENYDLSDGLQGNEFNQGAACRGSDGTLYFGGPNGVTLFQPNTIRSDSIIPAVVLTNFKIFDVSIKLPKALSRIDEINISYRQDFIAFEFAALDFSSPAKNQYAYRLEGFDRDWVYCGTRRYAAYTGLPGGEYTFRVKGSNSDGLWNETGASVRIIVTPPLWKEWWFTILSIVVVIALLVLLYRYRVRRIVELERLRARIASDLHDELASNLSSIALFSDLVHSAARSSSTLPGDHIKLLERITKLSGESVNSIRDIIWAIDPKPETAFDLLMRLHDTVIPLCRTRAIQPEFTLPVRERLPAHNLSPEQRKHLWLLLKEAVMNAVNHSSCTTLIVHHHYASGSLLVSVGDNGSGFDPAHESRGKGMQTIRMRAEQLGGAVEIQSVPGKGTTVRVTLVV